MRCITPDVRHTDCNNMDKIKVKQQVYGMGGDEKGEEWCAPDEAESIGEKEE